MTAPLEISQKELPALLAVLEHPEHTDKLGDRILVVTAIARRASRLTRISATLSGNDRLDEWASPNPTIRITMPEPPAEFALLEGAPQTTSRVYTLAHIDIETRLVQIDLVLHGESSPAMRWLHALSVGDQVSIVGPRSHRIPGPGAPRVLLADSSALPAATRIALTMPAEGETILIAAVVEDEFALLTEQAAAANKRIDARRISAEGATPLADAFGRLDLPARSSVWASGEREDMRAIRHRAKHDLGLPPERVQVFGYWKRGMTHTTLDVARLRATQRALDGGELFGSVDDFEIEL